MAVLGCGVFSGEWRMWGGDKFGNGPWGIVGFLELCDVGSVQEVVWVVAIYLVVGAYSGV